MNVQKRINPKKYILRMTIMLILVMLLVTGSTYALFLVGLNATNGDYTASTACFDVTYDATNDDGTTDITGTLFPSSVYTGGLDGNVTIEFNSACGVDAEGNIYLNVNSTSDNASVLVQTVGPHCENSKTLASLTGFTSQSACTAQTDAVWVTNGTALKYAVYSHGVDDIVSKGYVNELGETITIYGGFEAPDNVTYTIYIWLDGNISDNSYAGISVTGTMSADVRQESPAPAYAMYSADDKALRFFRTNETIEVGDTYNGLSVDAIYSGIEEDTYSSTSVPWYDYRSSITSVVFEDEITPASTKHWFNSFYKCGSISNITNLNTFNVTDMSYMFNAFGRDVTSKLNVDLSSFNTSNVTVMSYMFNNFGQSSSQIILDVSGWNTSKVTTMQNMFASFGYYSTSTLELDLSSWNTSSVATMQNMFLSFGRKASGVSIDLSGNFNKDAGASKNMYGMFRASCYDSTETFELIGLGSWNTSNVTNMGYMFEAVALGVSSVIIDDLGGWNVSNVSSFDGMFNGFGKYAENDWTIDLTGWDVRNLTYPTNFKESTETRIILPTAWQ